MKKFFLAVLIWNITTEVISQVAPSTDPWVKSAVIIADEKTQIVYFRKIDEPNPYSFHVKIEDVKKFQTGENLDVQFNNQRVHVIATRLHPEERIWVTDLHMQHMYAENFYTELLMIEKERTVNVKNTTFRKLQIVGRRESNHVRACCDNGTKNGIEFTIPDKMVESDLLPDVYKFHDLVIAQKQTGPNPLSIFAITGYYEDSMHVIDTTPPPPTQFEQDHIYAKPNTDTAQWQVDKRNAKSSTGRLFVNLPAGTAWDITIYPAGSSRVISNTMLQTSFKLLPGNYDLEINHIMIRAVTIEKGNDTRLRTGVLHISNASSWTLYDETKKKVLINSLSQEKRGLPVGRYILTIMGQDHDIEIKDGETLEY